MAANSQKRDKPVDGGSAFSAVLVEVGRGRVARRAAMSSITHAASPMSGNESQRPRGAAAPTKSGPAARPTPMAVCMAITALSLRAGKKSCG